MQQKLKLIVETAWLHFVKIAIEQYFTTYTKKLNNYVTVLYRVYLHIAGPKYQASFANNSTNDDGMHTMMTIRSATLRFVRK